MYKSSGYGSICKKDNHQPGSRLYSSVFEGSKVYTPNQIAPKLPSLFEGKLATLFTRPEQQLARYVPLSDNQTPNTLSKNNRFNTAPPLTSLAYRYDSIDINAPNSYPEFNSACKGTFIPKYNEGQRKLGPQGCTSCKAPAAKDYGDVPQLDSKYVDDDDFDDAKPTRQPTHKPTSKPTHKPTSK